MYINGIASVSPQLTNSNKFPAEINQHDSSNRMLVMDPDYKEIITSRQARRMSRVIKMGVYAARTAIAEAQLSNPDAIITGTGMGCLHDTEKFLIDIYERDEGFLNPTPFIQSTHNTVGAQIALLLKCNQYNFTYVHRGHSFESALLDGMMCIQEGSGNHILVGAADEIIESVHGITERMGHWRSDRIGSIAALKNPARGAIAGEGASFFVLSNQKQNTSYAEFGGLKMINNPISTEMVQEALHQFLQSQGMKMKEIDTVLLGISGDRTSDDYYHQLAESEFKNAQQLVFKQMSGDFHTVGAFAFWLGNMLVKHQEIPGYLNWSKGENRPIKNCLIYNHYRGINHSFMLLKSC